MCKCAIMSGREGKPGLDASWSGNPTQLTFNCAIRPNKKTKKHKMRCQVSTYSGHRLHERPLSFTWKEQRLEVREILEQGYEPDSLFFKVMAADGGVYLLRYHGSTDSWEARPCASRGHGAD